MFVTCLDIAGASFYKVLTELIIITKKQQKTKLV